MQEKFSFGRDVHEPSRLLDSHAYNPYPSTPYGESAQKVDASIRDYHANLAEVRGDELHQMHKDNMSQLDELQSQLSRSLAVLDVQEDVTPEQASPKKADFRATVKTDAAVATLHADLRKRKAGEGGIDNPFASRNYEAGLLRAEDDLDERQPIAKALGAEKAGSPELQLNVDSEAEFRAKFDAQVPANQEEQEPPVIALPEIDVDDDEMARMEKIMQGEK